MLPERVRFLILGAGPTGLGAAYRLKELGVSDFLVLDAAPRVGGLAASFRDEHGFTWDVGGHVQFSHYDYFDALMDKALGSDGWLNHERESWVWLRERFVPYPFQNNLRYLPKEKLWECLLGLFELQKRPSAQPSNFREWIHATFGVGIARVFFEPYNFKVWAHPLESMSYDWIGERVAVTDLERAVRNVVLERDDVSWGPNATFRFPKQGGTGAIWESVANLVGREHIFLNVEARAISSAEKRVRVRFTSGEERDICYEQLLSTMPLDTLASRITDLAPEVAARTRELAHSSTHIIGVGLEGLPPEALKKKCWMYFPEPNCPFYRVTVFSNYSPGNVPDIRKHWSLMAEVSESRHKPVDKARVLDDVINGLRATRLLDDSSRVISRWHMRIEHGYPTPTLGRNAILDALQPALQQRAIYSRGRFGGWKYEVSNQDHSLMQGVEWADLIVNGRPELTYWHPGKANAQRPRPTEKK
ncbi:MAG TPA: FAD-dependent oxidoreductase [Planctomycetota bacterium]|nr:FAD-dependent oxidoreductase [Planctomycetota bacterium]